MQTASPERQRESALDRQQSGRRTDVTLFIPDLTGGGAERVMVNLAAGLSDRGLAVDLLLVNAVGPNLERVPDQVNIVELGTRRTSLSLVALRRYLRSSRTPVLISALHHANLAVLFAKRIFGSQTRIIPTVHNTLSIEKGRSLTLKQRVQYTLVSLCYRWADGIVAVSDAAAEDFAKTTGIPRSEIETIYNPVVTPTMLRQAEESVPHPWFEPGAPPVVLGMGRLGDQKDFSTLIRAFDIVRSQRSARLVILGEGEQRAALEQLVAKLGLEDVVSLPGFVDNPYSALRNAAVFALSSRWEGLPTVLIEAMALGVPLVSTDCPSGPREILEGGRHGELVEVGDVDAFAGAIVRALDEGRRTTGQAAWKRYTLDAAVEAYARYAGVDAHG